MKRGILGALAGIVLSAVASTAKADVVFPSSGVWSQPRIRQNSSFVSDYNNVQPESFSFKTRVTGNIGETSTEDLIMKITGPEDFYWDIGKVQIPSQGHSERTKTDTFTIPGDYTLFAELGSLQISQDFTVVPEPYSIALLTLGAAAIIRRKRR